MFLFYVKTDIERGNNLGVVERSHTGARWQRQLEPNKLNKSKISEVVEGWRAGERHRAAHLLQQVLQEPGPRHSRSSLRLHYLPRSPPTNRILILTLNVSPLSLSQQTPAEPRRRTGGRGCDCAGVAPDSSALLMGNVVKVLRGRGGDLKAEMTVSLVPHC